MAGHDPPDCARTGQGAQRPCRRREVCPRRSPGAGQETGAREAGAGAARCLTKMPEKKDERERDIAVNRRAYHDYFIDEKLEAGIMLTGTEVKSVRNGRANLRDGFVRIDGNEAWLENVHISPYAQANLMNHEPLRPRKILLHRKESSRLIGNGRQKGYTLIPLRTYFSHNPAKAKTHLPHA